MEKPHYPIPRRPRGGKAACVCGICGDPAIGMNDRDVAHLYVCQKHVHVKSIRDMEAHGVANAN